MKFWQIVSDIVSMKIDVPAVVIFILYVYRIFPIFALILQRGVQLVREVCISNPKQRS